MKKELLEIALRYVDNTKEANDLVSELLLLFSVSGQFCVCPNEDAYEIIENRLICTKCGKKG